jgi:hypothetical protein
MLYVIIYKKYYSLYIMAEVALPILALGILETWEHLIQVIYQILKY